MIDYAKLLPFLLLVLLQSCLGGCAWMGAPKYPDVKNALHIKRGAMGVEVDVVNGADTDVSVESFNYNTQTNSADLKGLLFKSSQSHTADVMMKMFVMMQEKYDHLLATEGATINSLANTGAGALGGWFGLKGAQTQAQVDMTKMKADIVREVMEGIKAAQSQPAGDAP
jgi:hypothetical protein